MGKNTASNKTKKVIFSSLISSIVEFYDFYIYGIASASFLGPLFFPSNDKNLEIMIPLLTFGIAFISKPVGSIIFGHFGDKISRKTTLIISLFIMGFGTVLIGFLPTYSSIGIVAPILLCIMRFLQGIGMGGAWSGGAILATEYAPSNKRAIFGMFSQIAPPVAFIIASGVFLLLTYGLDKEQMLSWGWRIPFILSLVLIVIALYIRISIDETPVFKTIKDSDKQLKLPILDLFKTNLKHIILGALSFVPCYVLFFTVTVFSLSYMTTVQVNRTMPAFNEQTSLFIIMFSVIFMIISSPIAAIMSEKFGRKITLIIGGLLTIVCGLFFGPIMQTGEVVSITIYLSILLFLMGIINTPLAAFLPELFSSKVRYTGTSILTSLTGLLGGSLTPFITSKLNILYDIQSVGIFLSFSAIIGVIALLFLKETKNNNYYS